VGFACPSVEIHAVAFRAARVVKIRDAYGPRDETSFAIEAAQG
jgi:hypothetical protein